MEINESVPCKDKENKVDPFFQKLAEEFGIGIIIFLASLAEKSMEEDRRKKEENALPEK